MRIFSNFMTFCLESLKFIAAKNTSMKIITLFFILFLHFYYIKGQDLSSCSSTFTFEQTTVTDGNNSEIDLVLIEFEDVPNRSNLNGWEFRSTNLNTREGNLFSTPFSGDGFLYYAGSDFFNDGGNNIIEYKIEIANPGTYRFIYASAIGIFATDANPATEHNDTWVRFPDADAFFGYRDATNTIVIPNDEGVNQNNPDPNDPQLESDYPGATYKVPVNSRRSNKGFFKVYMNQLDDWWYEGATSDEDAHIVYARFDNPGTYTMQISGRSNGFAIDRAVLYKERGDFANLNSRNERKNAFQDLASVAPLCLASPSNFVGNKFSSTSVELSWTDNSTDESGFVVEASTQLDFSTVLNTKTVNAGATKTVFGGLEEGNTYFFRIRATFPLNNYSEYSEVIEIKTNIKPSLSGTIDLEIIGNSFLEFPKELFTQSFFDLDGDNIERLKIISLPDGIQNFEVTNVVDPISVNSEFDIDQIETNDGDTRFRYRATDDFTGKTSFTFTASDAYDFAEVAQTVHITVLKPQIQITQNGNIIDDEQGIDFGQVQVGDSSSGTLFITNTGNVDLSLTSLPLEITGNNVSEYVIDQQPLQSVLAAGESTELVVTFKPTSAGDKIDAHLVIANNDYDIGDQNFKIDLLGEGIFIGDPPELVSASSISVSENVVGTVYTAEASEDVTFTLGNSNDEALFTITEGDSNRNVKLNFIVSPDFENPADANQNNVYLVELIITDTDRNMIKQVVAITVTDILDETLPQITSGSTLSVEENTRGVFYSVTANEPVSFSLGNDKDETFFALSNDALSFKDAPDFENPLDDDKDNIYRIDLIATDAAGNTTTLEVSVTVTDVDENANSGPIFTSASEISVAENITGIFYKVETDISSTFSLGTENDEELFNLTNGELSFKEAPDYESPIDDGGDNVYLVQVIAEDTSGNISSLLLSVTVLDVDDTVLSILSIENELSVYPNPTSKKLYIDTNSEVKKVLLTDIEGSTVFKSEFTSSIDVENIPAGSYVLIIENAEGIFTKKIIIAR